MEGFIVGDVGTATRALVELNQVKKNTLLLDHILQDEQVKTELVY